MRTAYPLALALALLACAPPVTTLADDAADRERQARALLALSSAGKPASALAPMPRTALQTYAAGYRKSAVDGKPLVVFVGCPVHAVDGAVCCRVDADAFGDVQAPAVVVGFPQGERMLIDKAFTGECPSAEAVKKAVDAAAKKIDLAPPAKQMPAAPRPLDWSL